jgi:beta-lactamase regulating signal transducer with metallopeptidase domain
VVTDLHALRKLDAACADLTALRTLRPRIRLVEGSVIRTVGLLRPHIEVGIAVACRLDASALAGALLHEQEHARGLDPLRFVVANACQTLNPTAFLLSGEVRNWRSGREAVCDEAAVHRGADPLALAEALVAAARPAEAAPAAHLGGGALSLLRGRIALLFSYATTPPRCHCGRTSSKLAAAALVTLGLLPHYWGDDLITDVHRGAESFVQLDPSPSH